MGWRITLEWSSNEIQRGTEWERGTAALKRETVVHGERQRERIFVIEQQMNLITAPEILFSQPASYCE